MGIYSKKCSWDHFTYCFLNSLPPSPAETAGEVNWLRGQLRQDADIKVTTGSWRWSQEDQFPPLQCVLETKFWSDVAYDECRKALQQELLKPKVVLGGQFTTITTRGKDTSDMVPGDGVFCFCGGSLHGCPCSVECLPLTDGKLHLGMILCHGTGMHCWNGFAITLVDIINTCYFLKKNAITSTLHRKKTTIHNGATNPKKEGGATKQIRHTPG